MSDLKPPIPREALLLGVAGLAPFVGLSSIIALHQTIAGLDTWRVLALYSAVILSFMGGVHWGLAMKHAAGTGYSASVVPAIVGFLAVAVLPPREAVAVIATGFAALLLFDLSTVRKGGAPRWYSPLRIGLSAIVIACLLAAIIATA